MTSDFSSLEENLGINIHESIVEYFNSYWFADLDGFIKDRYIKLESVLPKAHLCGRRNELIHSI